MPTPNAALIAQAVTVLSDPSDPKHHELVALLARGGVRKLTAEALSEYVAALAHECKAGSNTPKQRGLDLGRIVREYPAPHLDEITPVWVRRVLDAERAKKKAEKTVKHYRMHLYTFLKWAKDRGHVPANPVEEVAAVKVRRRDPAVVRVADRARVLAAFKDDHAEPVVALCYLAGLRRAEAATLANTSVDWEKNVLRIRPDDCKTDAARVVPISDTLRRILDKRMRHPVYVCGAAKGGGWDENTLSHHVNAVMSAAGIKDTRGEVATLQTLRRTCETMLYDAGIPQKRIAFMMGHSVSVSELLYMNRASEVRHEDMEQVARAVVA